MLDINLIERSLMFRGKDGFLNIFFVYSDNVNCRELIRVIQKM